MKKFITLVLALSMVMSMSVTAFATDSTASTNDTSPHTVTNQDANGNVAGESNWVTDTNLKADGDNDAVIDAIGKLDSDGDNIPDDDDSDDESQAAVIAVDMTWDEMEWTYSKGSYDSQTMTSTSKWLDAEKNINVKNRSNVAITATPTYADANNDSNTNLKFASAVTKKFTYEGDMGTASTNGVLNLNAAKTGTVNDGTVTNGTPAEGDITVSLDMDSMTLEMGKDNDTGTSVTLGTITVTIGKQ